MLSGSPGGCPSSQVLLSSAFLAPACGGDGGRAKTAKLRAESLCYGTWGSWPDHYPDSDGALERIWSEWKSGKYLIEHQGLCDLTRTW